MKTLTYIIVILFILLVLGFVQVSVMNSKETEIKNWAIENKYEIKSIDHQITIFGSPFNYVNKGQFIFKVVLTNDEVWWVRTGVFSNDYEKE